MRQNRLTIAILSETSLTLGMAHLATNPSKCSCVPSLFPVVQSGLWSFWYTYPCCNPGSPVRTRLHCHIATGIFLWLQCKFAHSLPHDSSDYNFGCKSVHSLVRNTPDYFHLHCKSACIHFRDIPNYICYRCKFVHSSLRNILDHTHLHCNSGCTSFRYILHYICYRCIPEATFHRGISNCIHRSYNVVYKWCFCIPDRMMTLGYTTGNTKMGCVASDMNCHQNSYVNKLRRNQLLFRGFHLKVQQNKINWSTCKSEEH